MKSAYDNVKDEKLKWMPLPLARTHQQDRHFPHVLPVLDSQPPKPTPQEMDKT